MIFTNNDYLSVWIQDVKNNRIKRRFFFIKLPMQIPDDIADIKIKQYLKHWYDGEMITKSIKDSYKAFVHSEYQYNNVKDDIFCTNCVLGDNMFVNVELDGNVLLMTAEISYGYSNKQCLGKIENIKDEIKNCTKINIYEYFEL